MTTQNFADTKKPNPNTKASINDPSPIVLPGSQTKTAEQPIPMAPGGVASVSPSFPSPATPSSDTTIPPENVPLTPPPPPGGKVQTAPPTSIPPTPPRRGDADTARPVAPPSGPSPSTTGPAHIPPPPPPPKKRRRFRTFLITMILLSGLAYAGGVAYSLRSDNFHDFFTEYVPYGEEAVLYFEDREFRRRFPKLTNQTHRPSVSDPGNKVTIPSKSGLTWKVADGENNGSDLGQKGRHMSALEENNVKAKVERAQQTPSNATAGEKDAAIEKAKKDASPPSASKPTELPAPATKSTPPPEKPKVEAPPSKKEPAKPAEKPAGKLAPKPVEEPRRDPKVAPEVNEPSVFMPIAPIDPLKIKNADEPLVQDLVKIINDIITVANADNASGKYSSTMKKAKDQLAVVGGRIMALKTAEQDAAKQKIQETQKEFDNAARELVKRLEAEMRDQDAKWREEFESEREKISQSYEERLKTEIERTEKLAAQRHHNALLEQAIALKKQFLSDVTSRVETERNGRLSKLADLSSSVSDLESLTSSWNSVIDANLKTQHLQVAVDAVRSSLDQADRPRPFVKELAALKEIADADPVVDAAIASINPTAYQRGIPTTPQLIERFRRVAAEVRKASLLPEEAGVASHAASWVLSKVLFRKQGVPVGDDVESVLTRAETWLEEGCLDEAAREMNSLGGGRGFDEGLVGGV
ncbi:MAG: Formation of crista junctions 1 [Lasallia pustulata]|uniref:MICOS complex subunit MIC60 n=1 Tax=Lasallia pustulata TaxID=136370 RepID=A0A5M8PL76_9LECA|nr:MAG: Formation of crista junctions 1 [Lasallia pustulata]